MRKLLAFCSIIFCLSSSLNAQDFGNIYGDFYNYFTYIDVNESYINWSDLADNADFDGTFGCNLFYQNSIDAFNFTLDNNIYGYYGNSIDPYTSQPLVAPVSLLINQCYIDFMLGDSIIIYVGKKIKEIGNSSFFNVSNRISPKFLSEYSYSRNPPAYVEFNYLTLFNLTLTGIVYFDDISDIDNTNFMVSGKYTQGMISGDLSFYLEEFDYWAASLNFNIQLDTLAFYIESILKKSTEQKNLIDPAELDYTIAFATEPENVEFAGVLGISYGKNSFIARLEYLYRTEGFNTADQDAYTSYLSDDSTTYAAKSAIISSTYSEYALLQNYAALQFSFLNIFDTDLTINLRAIFSLQYCDSFFYNSSTEAVFNAEYAVSQNFLVSLTGVFNIGGDESEFGGLSDYLCRIILGSKLSF